MRAGDGEGADGLYRRADVDDIERSEAFNTLDWSPAVVSAAETCVSSVTRALLSSCRRWDRVLEAVEEVEEVEEVDATEPKLR